MVHRPIEISTFAAVRVPTLRFGCGEFNTLPRMLSDAGFARIGIITGSTSFRGSSAWERLQDGLQRVGITATDHRITGEPTPAAVDEIAAVLRADDAQAVVAIGGGSVLDAGKASAAAVCTKGSIRECLEGVGTRAPNGRTLPLYAVPTTAGTGTEATKNAVLSEIGPEGFKKSLRHENYVPVAAIIDPELAVGCPADVTAASGMDALTQLLEAWVSTGASPFTDALTESGFGWAARSLERAVLHGDDLHARSGMAYAAYLSGVGLANAGLGIVHGAASPIGARIAIPHGAFCGTMLAASVRHTLLRLEPADANAAVALAKYARAGELITGRSWGSDADNRAALVAELERLTEALELPRLSAFGVTKEICRDVAAATAGKAHPVPFSAGDVEALLIERL
ncbi:MAG: iron-containing alcohol dehydrogenase [Spirochaetaceae bacterium]|nr:MAG: iron-containing alcohol dehydrogenase [Spirochaetaceae bacterium]